MVGLANARVLLHKPLQSGNTQTNKQTPVETRKSNEALGRRGTGTAQGSDDRERSVERGLSRTLLIAPAICSNIARAAFSTAGTRTYTVTNPPTTMLSETERAPSLRQSTGPRNAATCKLWVATHAPAETAGKLPRAAARAAFAPPQSPPHAPPPALVPRASPARFALPLSRSACLRMQPVNQHPTE
eukprot:scaffold2090_cov225-Prasinococcus_capsulatus_cf.AAC.15